jgi:hypothetical protein
MDNAVRWAKTNQLKWAGAPASVNPTTKGKSAGTALIWSEHLEVTSVKRVGNICSALQMQGRAAMITMRHAIGLVGIASFYGNVDCRSSTSDILKPLAVSALRELSFVVIGGDFNVPVETMAAWITTECTSLCTIDVGPTYFGQGAPSRLDCWIISKNMRPLIAECLSVCTTLATDRPAKFSLRGLELTNWTIPATRPSWGQKFSPRGGHWLCKWLRSPLRCLDQRRFKAAVARKPLPKFPQRQGSSSQKPERKRHYGTCLTS